MQWGKAFYRQLLLLLLWYLQPRLLSLPFFNYSFFFCPITLFCSDYNNCFTMKPVMSSVSHIHPSRQRRKKKSQPFNGTVNIIQFIFLSNALCGGGGQIDFQLKSILITSTWMIGKWSLLVGGHWVHYAGKIKQQRVDCWDETVIASGGGGCGSV